MPTMNDILVTNDTSNSRWKVSYAVDEANTKSKILNTEGTYLDRNIQVEITTPAATFNTVNGAVIVNQGGFVDAGTTVGSSSSPATVTSGSATITHVDFIYNSTNDNFDITATETVSAPTVNLQGYISSTIGTKNTGTATVQTVTGLVTGSTSITGTLTNTPVISVQSAPAGVTNAADGSATTTTPGTGVYVTVKSAATTSTITATPSVTNIGYGTTIHHNLAGTTATVGANASATTYIKIKQTSMTKGTTSVSGTTATRGTATWGNGWITSGSLAAATFKNTATSGKTYVDISNTTAAPILTSAGYLYIDQGYTDYLKISLAKLIPNDANVSANNQLLSGYSAYDSEGNLYTGSITSKAAATYYPSTSDQTIASGQYLSGTQTFKAVTLANVTAGNIKSGVTIKIGDTADDDRIISVTGTFTSSSTVSSGQTAAAAAQIRSGYSAWVNGAEVKGSMGQATATITGTNVVTPTLSLTETSLVLSTVNNSGISLAATGGGTASVAATAKTNAVGYSGANGTTLGTATLSSGSTATTSTITKYLKEVTLDAPTSGTREFGIKIPDGDGGYMTWVFHIDSSGNVTIDDTYNLTY